MRMVEGSLQRIAEKVAASQIVRFASVQDIRAGGFLIIKGGLALRAGAGASTEVWTIEAQDDGSFQLYLAPEYGYSPELRSANVERVVVASDKDAVHVDGYGVGKRIATTKDNGVVVEFKIGDTQKRFVFDASVVQDHRVPPKMKIMLQAKSPEDASVKEYVKQYYVQAYGAEYGEKLAETFGDAWGSDV